MTKQTVDQSHWMAGYDCASHGGKLKTNPHAGGSPEWWDWHNGYKAAKRTEVANKRNART